MTTDPFKDAVAIDTNVFEHIMNPQENTESHINRLLTHLQEHDIGLVVDTGGKILGEYEKEISPIIRNNDDVRNEIYILRYWTQFAPCVDVTVDGNENLMTQIKRVIVERSETVDQTFVYVALKRGNMLISNDGTHIVYGPPRERRQPERRRRLLRQTRRMRPPGADILTSEKAHAKIPT